MKHLGLNCKSFTTPVDFQTALLESPSLTSFRFQYYNVPNTPHVYLEFCHRLVHLDIANSTVTPEDFKSFPMENSLRYLEFGGTQLYSNEGLRVLTERNVQLRVLNLSHKLFSLR